jgi:hypothetical protein
MPRKPEKKPKLTDAERFKRFRDVARQVDASEDPKDFDRAFDKVVSPAKRPKRKAVVPSSE